MGCTKKEYSLIDIDGLSTTLAEETWKEQTKNTTDEDLYDTVVDNCGEMRKVVKGFWTNEFFTLKEVYVELIAQYKKPENGTSEEGRNNN
jgi:hypothetical protein